MRGSTDLKARYDQAMSLPGMTTPLERETLFHWAKDRWQGKGAVVDLGSWLGSLIAPVAEGLQRNPRASSPLPKIHAYERFQYEKWMEWEFSRQGLPIPSHLGDSYEPLFWTLIEPWREQVVLYPGDVMTYRWSGEPVELLVVDVMKSWPLASYTLTEFFPHLVPGVSNVFHQDFAHWATPWVALSMFRLRHAFEVDQCVKGSGSVMFQLVKPISREALAQAADPKSYSTAECDEAIAWAREASCASHRDELTIARVVQELDVNRILEVGPTLQRAIEQATAADLTDENSFLCRTVDRWIQAYPSFSLWPERYRLVEWAQKHYVGWGRIVDVGTGLGEKGISLAEGLRRRTESIGKPRVEVIGSFRMESWLAGFFEKHHLPVKPSGESYRDLFDQLTFAWRDLIQVQETDIDDATVGEKPVECLVLEGLSHWKQAKKVLSQFAPLLHPGSLLVVRDFLKSSHALMPLLLSFQSDQLSVQEVFGTSVWFKVLGNLSFEETPAEIEDVPAERVEEVLAWLDRNMSLPASFEEEFRLTVMLLADRFENWGAAMERRAENLDPAFRSASLDRATEKMMFRLAWDNALRESLVVRSQGHPGGLARQMLEAYERFRGAQKGESVVPLVVHPSEGAFAPATFDQESWFEHAWARVLRVAERWNWSGSSYLRVH